MLTIIIGLIICGLLCLWLWKIWDSFGEFFNILLGTIAMLVLFVSLTLGLFVPIQGYSDKAELISETKLVTLSNQVVSEGHGGLFYVSVSANNIYTFRYEVDDKYEISGKSYKVGLLDGNVTEVESKNCKVPVLKEYKRKAKKGLFTFAFFQNRKEYVFYVPEGSIVKEVSLN